MSPSGITLFDICRHAASALGDGMQAEDVLEDLAVIRGRSHWGDARAGWLYTPDDTPRPLAPEMRFEDNHMCLDYIGHAPIALLFFFETEAELIEHILGDSGYFNPFTTLIIAFRHGLPAPFLCTYADDDGQAHIFHKQPDEVLDDTLHRMYPKRRLEWTAHLVDKDR